VIEGALEVAKDALHSSEMGLTGVMHVKAHMLGCVDVKAHMLVKVRYWRAPVRL
jgi:hypothetical protein